NGTAASRRLTNARPHSSARKPGLMLQRRASLIKIRTMRSYRIGGNLSGSPERALKGRMVASNYRAFVVVRSHGSSRGEHAALEGKLAGQHVVILGVRSVRLPSGPEGGIVLPRNHPDARAELSRQDASVTVMALQRNPGQRHDVLRQVAGRGRSANRVHDPRCQVGMAPAVFG